MTDKPVVVYGASGFSGRLIVEFLREYGVPFVAAGRDKGRLEEVLDHAPGISTANYEVAAVRHSVDELTDLFRGAKVVCNSVGPCIYYGDTVVEASLAAGCHGQGAYLQTGLIQAFAAHHLVFQPPRAVGFASPCSAFGHRELLAALEAYGLARLKVAG